MTPSHIIMQGDLPWYFYALILGFLCVGAWLGYKAGVAVWVLSRLGSFRKRVQEVGGPSETGEPARALTIAVWYATFLRVALFILVAAGTWVIIRDNFFSFQQLDISNSSMHLSYEWRFLGRELPLASIKSIEMVSYKHRQYGLRIATADGAVYRSMHSDDEAVVADCRHLVESFRKQQPNPAPKPN